MSAYQSLAQSQPQESNVTLPRPRNKRARPPISCLECRRKKLKCDRVQPCMQCKKSGRDALCTFVNGPPPPSRERGQGVNTPPILGQAPYIQIKSYDQQSGSTGWTPSSQPITPISHSLSERPSADISYASSLGCIYVKGKRSRYLGLGDTMTMLSHFDEAKEFIMKSFECASTAGMMDEMSVFQRSTGRKLKLSESISPFVSRPQLMASMLKSLPSAYPWDILFSAMPYWESLTRILHIPSFARDCEEIFNAVRAGMEVLPSIVRESLVPQLLATLALSARFSTGIKPSENERITEVQIGTYAALVKQWMDNLTGKERLNHYSLQTQTLLVLVHQANNASPSSLWKESGDLVRSAMIMGLQLDPTEYSEFSLFEKEQRRKLWRTIVELDIQFSLAASMPTALRASDFQMGSLKNVDDKNLGAEMIEYPPEKGQHVWTDAIAQIALGPSLVERLDAANRIGGHVNLNLDASFLLQRAADIEKSLQNLPTVARLDTGLGPNNDKAPQRLFARIMLNVCIRRPAFNIYRAITLSSQRSRYPEARKGAIRSAIELLSHLDALDPTVADLNIIKDRDLLNLFHLLCKNDIMQAAHFLCFEIQKLGQSTPGEAQNRYSPSEEISWTKHSLTRIVENTLNSLLQRLGQFGSDLKDVLPLSIVLHSVRSGGTRNEKLELMHRGSERVLSACRLVMPEITEIATMRNSEGKGTVNPEQAPATSWDPSMPAYTDMDMLGMDVDFQGFDAEFNSWDMNQSWL